MAKNSFENALTRLEKITEELESGDLSLEKSLEKFTEGMTLVHLCNGKLEEAKSQIELLLKKDETIVSVPFTEEEGGNPNLPG
ncbi:exodeoxyribonuclease VII small subunit [Desulfobulbus oligotrophicus]|jgi:exodeoxyribonuclease VII small subunit|uniref:Exodeoxyribonuclease 7 small subunit n=1 Tax=Desulfobulbus oligotrophicus TaxID=1909699 RepID=A0A7T5VAM7_9BACT|nr:exodeoxyribonuclease VII small subunit [Desulfobulbus oligotrophicus]MDY0391466.1 exodeoxyribonuclease VII small subunit [Desulfobulbus oligotrophicus]QQG64360.1 exodeoxyribonuclease VII small subunit [Desulfobulbus oligotrophicus]